MGRPRSTDIGKTRQAVARSAQSTDIGKVTNELDASDLLHLAYVKLLSSNFTGRVESRLHFLRILARTMRFILVDLARARGSIKRGGVNVQLDEYFEGKPGIELNNIALNEALEQLGDFDSEAGRVVQLIYFEELTLGEAAKTINTSLSEVYRREQRGLSFLNRVLSLSV